MKLPSHPQTREAFEEWVKSLRYHPIVGDDIIVVAFCAGWTEAMRLCSVRLAEMYSEVEVHVYPPDPETES